MSVPDTSPERPPQPGFEEFGELEESVVCALGDSKTPLDANELITSMPAHYQEVFHNLVANTYFPGKEKYSPEIAGIEYYFARHHHYVGYYYHSPTRPHQKSGYVLTDAGLAHYHEIIQEHEATILEFVPTPEPLTDSLVRSVGGGTLAAVWTA